MGFTAFESGVNVIAYKKNEKIYSMTCAWAMMVDYDKIMMLLGSQSVTGRNLEKGDIIGVSALNSNQKEIANRIGSSHSDEENKLKNIEYTEVDTCITINNSTRQMCVKVLDILHPEGIESDALVYGLVLEHKENNTKFLTMSEMREE